MADDAVSRQRLFRALEEILGLDLASQLMASVPPHGWDRLATKDDLEALRIATKDDLEALRIATKEDMAVLRGEMQNDLEVAVLRLERLLAEQSASFERALRTELSRQSRAAVLGMVGMMATVGGFVLGLLNTVA